MRSSNGALEVTSAAGEEIVTPGQQVIEQARRSRIRQARQSRCRAAAPGVIYTSVHTAADLQAAMTRAQMPLMLQENFTAS